MNDRIKVLSALLSIKLKVIHSMQKIINISAGLFYAFSFLQKINYTFV